jgi:hypothetical protein
MFFISVLTVIYISIVFFLLGGTYAILNKQVFILHRASLIIYITVCFYQIFNQGLTTFEYAKKYDERIEFVIQNCTTNNTLTLENLPSSGLLFSAEISADSAHFSNQHFKKGLGVDCKLKTRISK